MKRNGQQRLHVKRLQLKRDMKRLSHLVASMYLVQSVTNLVVLIISYAVVQVVKAIQVSLVSTYLYKMI